MGKNTKGKMAQSKTMEVGTLVDLVGRMANAAKGTAYTDAKGKARANSGVWVNVVYPRGAALNDILRQHGFDPIASVQAAVKVGKLKTRPAGGHSIAVAIPEAVTAAKPAITDVGTKYGEVASQFFKPAKPAKKTATPVVVPVKLAPMPWKAESTGTGK
jgi:hypothetical protein